MGYVINACQAVGVFSMPRWISSVLGEPQRPSESFCTLQPNSAFPASTHSSTLCAVNERQKKKKNPRHILLDQRIVVIEVCCCCHSRHSPFWSRSHAAAFMASSSHSSRESSLKPWSQIRARMVAHTSWCACRGRSEAGAVEKTGREANAAAPFKLNVVKQHGAALLHTNGRSRQQTWSQWEWF